MIGASPLIHDKQRIKGARIVRSITRQATPPAIIRSSAVGMSFLARYSLLQTGAVTSTPRYTPIARVLMRSCYSAIPCIKPLTHPRSSWFRHWPGHTLSSVHCTLLSVRHPGRCCNGGCVGPPVGTSRNKPAIRCEPLVS